MTSSKREAPRRGIITTHPDDAERLARWWSEFNDGQPDDVPVIYREAMERLMELTEALAGHPEASTSGMARAVLADIKLVRQWLRRE